MSRKFGLLLLLNFSLTLFVSLTVLPLIRQASLPAGAAEVKGLQRLDFILEHASCATCILKVRKALRDTAGVVKCQIELRKPYGGVVIFEADKIKVDKMKNIAREADPKKAVEFGDMIVKPVDSVPAVLIPVYNSLKKGP